jgi:hypothetical protein
VASLRPEPGDHEERVVDRDGEADEDDQLGRVGADRGDGLAVEADEPERREERGHGEDQGDEARHDRPEGEQEDRERQRQGDPERAVEIVGDEVVDVAVDERAADDVDRRVGHSRPCAVDDRLDRGEQALDLRILARDVADDLDRRPVGRDEASLRRRREGIDELVERGCVRAVHGRVGSTEVGHKIRHGGLEGRVGGRTPAAIDDDDDPLAGNDRLAGPEGVVGLLGLEAGPARILVDVDRLRPAGREAGREEPDREH